MVDEKILNRKFVSIRKLCLQILSSFSTIDDKNEREMNF